MKLEVSLSHLPREWFKASRVVRPNRPARGRPLSHFRLAIETEADAATARRLGAPVFLLTPEIVTALGYPVVFPPHLLISSDFAPAVDSTFPRIVVPTVPAARPPVMEDVIVALLRIDPLAARGVASRNRASVEPLELLRRVVQAEAEGEATRVNLQEFSALIPRVGSALPQDELEEQDRTTKVIGLRA